MYGILLWADFTPSTLDKVRVAYNNVFRAFMSVDRRSSVSAAFIQKGINHFTVLYRKVVYGFKSRLFDCNNSIVQNVIQSPFFIYKSELYTLWHDHHHHKIQLRS